MPLPPTRNSDLAGGGSGSTKSPLGVASRTIVPGCEAVDQVGGEEALGHRAHGDGQVAAGLHRRRAHRVGAPVELAVDLDPDADVLAGPVLVAPAPAGPDHQGRGVLGLGDDLLDPAAQLARAPQRVEQGQVVVGEQRRRELVGALRTRSHESLLVGRLGGAGHGFSEQLLTRDVNHPQVRLSHSGGPVAQPGAGPEAQRQKNRRRSSDCACSFGWRREAVGVEHADDRPGARRAAAHAHLPDDGRLADAQRRRQPRRDGDRERAGRAAARCRAAPASTAAGSPRPAQRCAAPAGCCSRRPWRRP